jgi:hypothetical protein
LPSRQKNKYSIIHNDLAVASNKAGYPAFQGHLKAKKRGFAALFLILAWEQSGIAAGIPGGFLLTLNPLVDFFAMHSHFFRRVDTDAYLVTLYTKHRNRHFIPDHKGFTDSTR